MLIIDRKSLGMARDISVDTEILIAVHRAKTVSSVKPVDIYYKVKKQIR